jgi:hypothetical protein
MIALNGLAGKQITSGRDTASQVIVEVGKHRLIRILYTIEHNTQTNSFIFIF